MNKIFVTSDTHLNHKNICGPALSSWESGYRNFDSLESMNNRLIDNLNAVIGKDDVLYHLGDFAMGQRKLIPELRERINCRTIHLILGNHDDKVMTVKENRDCFSTIQNYLEMRVKDLLVVMCHYPLGSWNEIGKGAIQLYGHCHGSYEFNRGRQLDVGVDSNDFKPWLLDDLVENLALIEPASVDHHNAKTSYH